MSNGPGEAALVILGSWFGFNVLVVVAVTIKAWRRGRRDRGQP